MNLWVENPYWQAFCGFQYMQHNAPIYPSSLSRWRNRVGAERFELLLKVVIETALKMKALKPGDLKKINVDTTVQQKAIAFPTDSRLYLKMRLVLASDIWRRRQSIIKRPHFEGRLIIVQKTN